MAAQATRKRTNRMVAPEASRSTGTLQLLPAGNPEVVEPADEQTALAAMAAPGKGATKKAPPAAKKPPAKPPATVAPKVPSADQNAPATRQSHSTPRAGDPDVAYAFSVKINQVVYAMFSEIAGLSWKAEPIPVRVGGNNEYSLNMRGPGKFEPLTLKRGWFACTGEFYDMLADSLSGSSPRSANGRMNLSIAVLDRKYQEIGTYDFSNAFIIEYSGPSLNSMSGQVGFEQIRMAYDKFTYKPKG